jgi:hypothetical protein
VNEGEPLNQGDRVNQGNRENDVATLVSRREFVVGSGLAVAAAGIGADVGWLSSHRTKPGSFRALTAHQAAVIEAATARLVPGPEDDPAEAGHPGAREANIVGYIDTMLGALRVHPPKVYAGGPFSNRNAAGRDDMAHFLKLPTAIHDHWRSRLATLRQQYGAGVVAYDHAAQQMGAADYTKLSQSQQDQVLAADLKANPNGFTNLLFTHTTEGMYSVPEYGGNESLVGWKEIKFRGDTQPTGWPDAQVSDGDGPDPYQPTPIVQQVLAIYTLTAPPPLPKGLS